MGTSALGKTRQLWVQTHLLAFILLPGCTSSDNVYLERNQAIVYPLFVRGFSLNIGTTEIPSALESHNTLDVAAG